ncbi:hypothetical protein P0082_09670 [Candidatus Haliotispira prima]|uniref:Cell division protein FtsL n=1 Tax=Candidatus Haliotispira prima TaxID=3034016 RepID=A0ABY8MHR9_9SPIO|nr:hypothetical protein P0082_09670 [Candidatus Haliotispira prima]
MKKWLSLFIVMIPLSMMLNVHQSKTYSQVKLAINSLQRKQNQLLEENQKVIAEIARSGAPTAIEQLVRSEGPNLGKISPDQVLRIVVPEEDVSP